MNGRVVVVTGGGGGIGAAIARRFLTDGDFVVIADVRPGAADDVVAEHPSRCSFTATDVSSEADMEALIRSTVERHQRIDVMCNNAAILGSSHGVRDIDLNDYHAVFSTNVVGVLLGTKFAASAMIASGGGGSIVNTASVAGLRGGVGPILYSAAKHAVVGLTRSAASELARHKIRVNAVAPGVVPTPMAAQSVTGDPTRVEEVADLLARRAPFGRASTVDDIAGVVAFLAGDDSGYMTGEVLLVDGGATMAAPKRS